MSASERIGLRICPEGTPSTGTLTVSSNPSGGDTVTIDGITYTFEATPAAAYDVDIGASASESIDNLVKAINNIGQSGVDFFAGTKAHPTVHASPGAGDTMIVTALTLGTDGDSITTTASGPSFGGGTLSGGVDRGATPTNSPNWLAMCYTSEDLAANNQYDRSERICDDFGGAARMPRKRTLSGFAPGGSVNLELMYGPLLHELFRGALLGQWVEDFPAAGQFQSNIGVSQQTYTIEKIYSELGSTYFEHWTGAMINQLSMSLTHGQKATGVVQFVARNHDADATSSLVGSGSVTGEPSNEILAAARDFAAFQIDDSAPTDIIVNQVDLQIANNGRPRNGLGNLGPASHVEGEALVSGTIAMYLSAGVFAEYRNALDNVTKKLEFNLTDPAGNTYHWEFPEVNFTADPPSSPGRNQDVFWRAPFEAFGRTVFVYRDDA